MYTDEQITEWREKAEQLDDIISILDTEMGREDVKGADDVDFEKIGKLVTQKIHF